MIKGQNELEFAITQYLDGTLSEFDRRVLEERLATDAEARLLLEEYRHLDVLLRGSRQTPDVDYDALAASISSQIDQEEAFVPQPMRMTGVWVARLAIAAGLALAVVVGWQVLPQGQPDNPVASDTNTPGGASAKGELIVQVPALQQPDNAPAISIAVGPSQEMLDRGLASGMVDDAFHRPAPRVVISAVGQPRKQQDDRLY